ncbi:putative 3-oxoacyl-[acyl-carrier-protein] synthase, mitochondrial [Schizosaccharomyces pombe]
MKRVVITGLGAVTPLGNGVKTNWRNLIQGKSGIVSLKGFPEYEQIPSKVAGVIPRGKEKEEWNVLDYVDQGKLREVATFTQLALTSAAEALKDARWIDIDEQEKLATGVCFGTGIGNLDDALNENGVLNKAGIRKVSPRVISKILINMPAGYISQRYGFTALNHTTTTACAAGCHAIGDAFNFIKLGHADVILAGGSESCINPLTVAGFSKARSLSTKYNDNPKAASRPFDANRDGFVIGEGSAALVLEELEHAKNRNAHIYAEIVGYGLASDSYHITAPNPNGDAAYYAMKRSLKQAGLSASQLDYINAHATSTKLGDVAESIAITRLLCDVNRNPEAFPVSSSKGSIGHLLGAAGAIESVYTVLTVQKGVLPPTLNFEYSDIPQQFQCDYVPNVAKESRINVALSNSFGFGGTNASLCFKKFLQ